MDLFIVVSLKVVREMEKEDFNGQMVSLMMDNGLIMLNMVVAFGKAKIHLHHILVNGIMELFLDLEY